MRPGDDVEEAYVHWIRRYVLQHDRRHPQEMGAGEVRAFLSHLAVSDGVAASTQNAGGCGAPAAADEADQLPHIPS